MQVPIWYADWHRGSPFVRISTAYGRIHAIRCWPFAVGILFPRYKPCAHRGNGEPARSAGPQELSVKLVKFNFDFSSHESPWDVTVPAMTNGLCFEHKSRTPLALASLRGIKWFLSIFYRLDTFAHVKVRAAAVFDRVPFFLTLHGERSCHLSRCFSQPPRMCARIDAPGIHPTISLCKLDFTMCSCRTVRIFRCNESVNLSALYLSG